MADGAIVAKEDRKEVEKHRERVRKLMEIAKEFEVKLSNAQTSKPEQAQ